eukprot:TRINITY_DN8140_c0_g1_i1.p1 TRINITY_DN8140_c0_g1~~TRINITY_DN8140_c0_g1_i1.p1  ORF type:complete len:386 (-),score=130.35 TRINITY_DN8140_c0_g1_i1:140-1297(-)
MYDGVVMRTTLQQRNMSVIIDGNAIAKELREQLKAKISAASSSTTPGLAVVLVGDRKDSATYVNMKKKACAQVGIISFDHNYPADVTQATLEELIDSLNSDSKVHGILVQLPLPDHINSLKVLGRIDPRKDVDGIHAVNMGKLAVGVPDAYALEPCTPKGVIHLIRSTGFQVSGKRACVVGRSNIVGKPVAFMLLRENATVTVCHSKTPPELLEDTVRSSDIVIAACGKPELIKGDWIKKGAIVIDVGINSVDDPSSPKGFKLCGDVEFSVAKENAGFISPELLEDTVRSSDIVIAACGKPELIKGDWIKKGAIVIDVGINSVDDPSSPKGFKLCGDVEFSVAKENAGFISPVPGGVGPMTIAMLLANTFTSALSFSEEVKTHSQ